jgi:hypothetical protein
MPVYEIEHPKTKQKIRLEGDGVPSDADIKEAFARIPTTYTPAETERLRRDFVANTGTAKTRIKDAANQAFNPTAKIAAADGVGDFAGRVLPQSITQLPGKVVLGAYEAIKGQTDPLVNSLASLKPTGELPGQQMQKNALNTLHGAAEATAAPVGLMGAERFKEAWLTDPAMSALAVAPVGYMGLKGAKAAKGGVAKALGTPEDLARSALKPYIGESAARQKQVTKGLKTAVEDPNASARMPKFMERNLKEMEEIAGRQDVFLNEKGNPMAPIGSIRDALKGTVNNALDTPGTAEAATAAAEKVLADIINHPAYDAATDSIPLNTVQTMKRNIWKKLREKGTFNSDSVPGLQDAMWDAAGGMNDIINKHVPEMAAENARYGELANVNKLLKRATDRHANNNIIPLRSLIMLVRGDVKGFSAATATWALDHPTFKLYIAQRMAKGGKKPSAKQVDATVEAIKTELVQREQTVLDSENVPQGSRSNLGDTIPGGYQREYGWEGKQPVQAVENPEVLPGRQSSQVPTIPGVSGRVVSQQEAMAPKSKVKPVVGPLVFDPSTGRMISRKQPDMPVNTGNLGRETTTVPKPSAQPVKSGTKTWREFLSANMGAAMKSEGGHAGAIRKLAKEWNELKKK